MAKGVVNLDADPGADELDFLEVGVSDRSGVLRVPGRDVVDIDTLDRLDDDEADLCADWLLCGREDVEVFALAWEGVELTDEDDDDAEVEVEDVDDGILFAPDAIVDDGTAALPRAAWEDATNFIRADVEALAVLSPEVVVVEFVVFDDEDTDNDEEEEDDTAVSVLFDFRLLELEDLALVASPELEFDNEVLDDDVEGLLLFFDSDKELKF